MLTLYNEEISGSAQINTYTARVVISLYYNFFLLLLLDQITRKSRVGCFAKNTLKSGVSKS